VKQEKQDLVQKKKRVELRSLKRQHLRQLTFCRLLN
jgi:hypothetical protein